MSARTSFGRDTGLQARMLVTMLLLGLVYAVLIAALIAAGVSIAGIVVIAVVMFVLQVYTSDKIGLAVMGAKPVTPEQAPELHAMIERLCVQADLPKPKIAVAQTSMPNAFAMGRSQKSATVCVTTGIMELLSPPELEGVLAHELTHVINRDVMIMTIASFFAMLAGMITQFGFFYGGGRSRNGNDQSFAIVLLVSIAVYVISFVLMRTLSRYREFAADRGAVIITGRPSALASALLKISGTMSRVPQQDLRAAEQMNAFFIIPAAMKQGAVELFATHPSLEKRIARLQRYEAQLQGTAGA
ncbi:MAG: zinc metalloprotease HtpX [Solirubrobacterales bacterium]